MIVEIVIVGLILVLVALYYKQKTAYFFVGTSLLLALLSVIISQQGSPMAGAGFAIACGLSLLSAAIVEHGIKTGRQ